MIKYFPEKAPDDEYYLTFDFSDVLGDELVSSAVITVLDADDVDVTDTLVDSEEQDVQSQTVYFWVRAGEHDAEYTVACRVVGAAGTKVTKLGILSVVRDAPDLPET